MRDDGRMEAHRRRLAAVAVGLAALGWTASAEAAETLYGTTGTKLVRLSSASPATIDATRPITGMQPGETTRAIDVRPATGELIAVGSTGRLYRVDPGSGASESISSAGIALVGGHFGADFSPSADRLRVVSNGDANFRYNPLDGTGEAFTDLGSAGDVVAIAYDRNTPGAAATTLFGLDSASDKLVRIGGVDGDPPVNQGAVTEIGPTGFDFGLAAGFDVAPSDGTPYASLVADGATSLYTIDLATGGATKVGDIGDAAVIDIAVAQPRYTHYTAIDGSFTRGHTDSTGIEDETPLAGLEPGELIVGLDQRPATGELVALTDQGRLYLVDPLTSTAAQIGSAPIAPPVGSPVVGFDFNPLADRIRIVAANETNYRLVPLTGAALVDTPLNPAGEVTAAAYLNSFPGATTTVLYDIDAVSDMLLIQNPPNFGMLTEVGPLETSAAGNPTIGVAHFNGFDIAPAGGFGFLATRADAGTGVSLFRVNLAGGAVTGGRAVEAVELVPAGGIATGLAIMSPGLLRTGSTSALETGGSVTVAVARAGGATGPATVEYATANGSAKAGEDYTAVGGVLRFVHGETAKLIDVPLLDDTAFEEPEEFTLTLSKPGEGAVLGPATATVTLGSEDAAPAPIPTPTATPAPPPTPTPVAPGAVADTAKPLAFVTARPGQTIKTVRSKGLRLQLVAGEAATATISATITARTARTLKLSSRTITTGKATFSAAGVRSVTLKLTSKAKKGLKRSKKPVAVSVAATVTDLARNASSAKASVVLPVR